MSASGLGCTNYILSRMMTWEHLERELSLLVCLPGRQVQAISSLAVGAVACFHLARPIISAKLVTQVSSFLQFFNHFISAEHNSLQPWQTQTHFYQLCQSRSIKSVVWSNMFSNSRKWYNYRFCTLKSFNASPSHPLEVSSSTVHQVLVRRFWPARSLPAARLKGRKFVCGPVSCCSQS